MRHSYRAVHSLHFEKPAIRVRRLGTWRLHLLVPYSGNMVWTNPRVRKRCQLLPHLRVEGSSILVNAKLEESNILKRSADTIVLYGLRLRRFDDVFR
jgi:hypothetical protein